MNIKKISINNFGPYSGENNLNFNIKNGKNISIITANNGEGKTSFLKSLGWLFYGNDIHNIKSFDLRKEQVEKFKKEILSRWQESKEYSVEVELNNVSLNDMIYEVIIKRSFSLKINQEKLEITITKNSEKINYQKDFLGMNYGDDDNQEEIQKFINQNFLDISLANYFFYDTEKMGLLSDNAIINTDIYDIFLGIKPYTSIAKKIKRFYSTYTKKENNNLRELNKDEDEKNKAKYDIRHEIINEEEIIREKKKSIEEFDKKILEKKEFNKKHDDSTEKIKDIKNKIENDKEKLKTLKEDSSKNSELWTFWALSLHKQFIKTIKTNNNNDAPRRNWNEINTLLKNFPKEIKQEKYYIKLKDFLFGSFSDKEKGLKKFKNYIFRSLSKDGNIDWEIIEENSDHIIKITEFSNKYERLNSKIAISEEKINDLDKKEHQDLKETNRKEIDDFKKKIELENEQLEKSKIKLSELKSNLEKLTKKLISIREEIDFHQEKVEIAQRLNRFQKLLKEFVDKLREKKKDEVNKNFLDNLRRNLTQENTIFDAFFNIDTGNFVIQNDNRKDMENFSEGQKQVIMSSFIQALSKTSEIKFPFIIDSPTIRLDSKHKEKLLKSFQKTAEHVIMTPIKDEEYNKLFKEIIYEYTADVHIIKQDDDKKKSYFRKEK